MIARSFFACSIAFFAFFYTCQPIAAQTTDPTQEILPPSPTAASLTNYVDFPVNTTTGIPSISIPIGAVSGNSVSAQVSLDYHAGGVKVDAVSGNIGLGWSLNAGGAITRTVMGKQDELADGFMYHGNDVPIPPISSSTEFTAMQAFAQGNWDGQPDMFQFSFGGYSGKFVFDDPTTVRLIPLQDLKISSSTCSGAGCPTGTENGSIISFSITTPDGLIYLFGTLAAVETSKSLNYNVSGYTGCRPKEFVVPVITSWFLKSITNPRSGDAITFTYTDNSVTYDVSYNESYYLKDPSSNTNCPSNSSISKCVTEKTDKGKQLASITAATGRVDFISSGSRSDVNVTTGQCKINEIRFYGNNNALLKYYLLDQTFVQSTGSTPSTKSSSSYRMYLDAVREFDANSVQIDSWQYTYYNRSSLTPRLSYKQDHWGYFNNKNNTQLTPVPEDDQISGAYMQSIIPSYVPANREPDPAYSYYGNLQRVTYPTGGYIEYEYEGNEIAVCNNVDVPTPANASLDLMFTGTVQSQTANFTIATEQSVSITYNVQQNGLHFEGAYAKLKEVSPNPHTIVTYGAQLQSPAVIQGTQNMILPPGEYQIEVKVFQGPLGGGYPYPFNNLPERATINVAYTGMVPTYFYNKPTGGIRLKKSTVVAGSGGSPDIVRLYKYNAANGACTNASSAVYLGDKPTYHTWEFSTITSPLNYLCLYHRVSSSSLKSLTNHAGAIVSYAEFWEWQGSTAQNGKKYYKHQIFADQPYETDPLGFEYQLFVGSPTSDYSWKSGKVIEEKALNASGQTVSQKLYDYEFNETNNTNTLKTIVARKAYEPVGTYDYNTNPAAAMEPYVIQWCNVISQFVYLKKTTDRIYNSDGSGNYVETITDHQYDTPLFRHYMPIKTITTNSDGAQYATRTVYPPEYNTSTVSGAAATAIRDLKTNYIINVPVEIVQTLKKSGQTEKVTGAQLIKYKNFSGTRILPNELWQVGTTSALSDFTWSNIGGDGTFGNDARYYQTRVLGSYDTKGHLLEWNKTDDQVSSFLYWYGTGAAIAYAQNALSTEIAYTSFEIPSQLASTHNGNWAIGGTNNAADWNTAAGYYHTGKTGYKIGTTHPITRSGLPVGNYVVSFFYRDGQVKVNNTTIGAAATGNWQYAETKVNITGGTVTVVGAVAASYIDELRLHPADALMRTIAPDNNSLLPLSMSDENSVSAHYEYDKLLRLQVIRDQDRNIVQTYEYNYQQGGTALNDIKARTVLASGQTTVTQVNALTGANVRRVFQYLDGLGRPIQTNAIGQSPTSLDNIAINQYDFIGREPKQYLTYNYTTNSTTPGVYHTDAVNEQNTFGVLIAGSGGYAYGETRFEASPLNRALEQSAPGATWRIGQGRTSEFLYRGNTSTEAVRDFTNSNSFANNLLLVREETDENERKKLTFSDKLGQVIMVRQQIANTPSSEDNHWARTYTVYDDFGRPVAVIPPEAAKKMKTSGNWDWTSATYANMIYKYAYDSRGRMISKTVPSAGTTTINYDKLDRPVLTTDGKSFKVFTRYDILSRPVMTGRYRGSNVPATGDPLYEIPNSTGPHYYSTTAFPTDNTNVDVYKVFYYDDHDFDNNGSLGTGESYTSPIDAGFETAASLRTRGKPTGAKTGILKTDQTAPTTFLITRTYYDKEYSVIQVNKQNHLGGTDITSNAYDFANRLTKIRRKHTATPPGGTVKKYIIREEYTLDHAGRVRFTRHNITTDTVTYPTTGWVVTSAPVYDELNRVADKRLHASNYDGSSAITLSSSFNYLQSLDYTYNIRNWLTAMNDVTTCSAQAGDQVADLFKLQLSYDAPVGGGTAQYNGNISTLQWRSYINTTCLAQQQYRFTYDATNRLTAADHYTNSSGSWTFTNNYTESGITYDLNGNIKTYTRRGLTSGTSTFGIIDNLGYTYDTNRPDRLISMAESGSVTKGFKYKSSILGDHYIYDSNGNLTQDKHKDLTIDYNYLNLPVLIYDPSDAQINFTYTADGEKLTKNTSGVAKNYVSGIEYAGANLEAIYHSEGRCVPNGATAFYYEYTIKDHLGNARVNWRANGTSVTFLEELHYYPFGMLMEGIGTNSVTVNAYKYNSKELNADLGLNWYDYGARWYDPAVGRWWSVDPMAEKTVSHSTYTYALNNPALLIDPNGMLAGNPFEVMEERKQKANERREESDEQSRESVIEKWRESGDMRTYDFQTKPLKKVNITVTDNIVGSAKVVGFSHKNGRTKDEFEVPLYEMIVSGTDAEGNDQSRSFKVIRFGVEQSGTGKSATVVGLKSAQSYRIRSWNAKYLEGLAGATPGAWRITKGWLLHDGSDEPTKDAWGAIGCIEVCGKADDDQDNFTRLNWLIRSWSGATLATKSVATQYQEIARQGVLTVTIQHSKKPPLIKL